MEVRDNIFCAISYDDDEAALFLLDAVPDKCWYSVVATARQRIA